MRDSRDICTCWTAPWHEISKLKPLKTFLGAAMSHISVSGQVVFQDGSAYLRITPRATSSEDAPEPPPPPPTPTPWPSSTKRSDDKILEAINTGTLAVHPSRRPMKSTDLRLILNNIQTTLGLPKGLKGGWSPLADQKLLKALMKAKSNRKRKQLHPPYVSSIPLLLITSQLLGSNVCPGCFWQRNAGSWGG